MSVLRPARKLGMLQAVLLGQLAEPASLLAGKSGRQADVAVRSGQQLSNIGSLEAGNRVCLRYTECRVGKLGWRCAIVDPGVARETEGSP